ncbi:MAG: alkylphosphonate utilization protein [Halobacteriovoraceae bacterium]|nr:alkylphosphonate utilization protein [Halobacteriovoraceae bacterium]|tara:strand:+ start:6484 stop:6831 length:348 start_codon:yes stop_codon:yes gene_type:complete
MDSQVCKKCQSPYGYFDGNIWTCPECFHEWSDQSTMVSETEVPQKFLDSNGNQLSDGDSVTTIKNLKAGKDTIKAGTKVKNIKLLEEPVNDHDISCKIAGFGHMYLKCSVVKKQN